MSTPGEPSGYAASAARILRRARQETPVSLPSDHRRLVGVVEQALAARAHRRRAVKVWGLSCASVAAAVLIVVGIQQLPHQAGQRQGAVVTSASAGRAVMILDDPGRSGADGFLQGSDPTPLRRGMELPPGIRLVAPALSEVQLGTATGTVMTLEKAASLTVRETSATQRFELHRGAVRVRVAPLLTGERFLIDTDEAEIEVRGTSFRVAVLAPDVACADRERTKVTVSEGVVTVRSKTDEVRLTPGSVWQSTCAAVTAAAAAPRPDHGSPQAVAAFRHRASAAVREDETAPRPVGPAAATPTAPAGVLSPSVLAAQNDLFAAALRANERGRSAEAIALFDRLLAEHPRSPLAESAAAHRMKLLGASDRAAAGRAAVDYLRRFPGGFARQEAQALVQTAGASPGAPDPR